MPELSTVAPTHVIAIGASAGGLEPLEHLFDATPPNTGFAFVVVQHLSPDHKSLMHELLERHTAMPIRRVENGMQLESNTVYLIPPKQQMTVESGLFKLEEQDRKTGLPPHPIDTFFESVAQGYGKLCVGIVLSGTGSDGARGVVAIHAQGGLTIAQNSSARFDGMPASSIATEAIDIVLGPEVMTDCIIAYIKDPASLNKEAELFVGESDQEALEVLFKILKRKHAIDFRLYKPGTVQRRIRRRMEARGLGSLPTYAEHLVQDESEQDALFQDMLISVTQFMRDKPVWDALNSEVLPGLFEHATDNGEIRCWVAACATGEEAYTLTILMSEWADRNDWSGVLRIFATDADRAALERASAGVYKIGALNELDPHLVEKYFTPVDDNHVQVRPVIRKRITFASHNLVKDAPFTRMDLVTCRNMLIYLKSAAQNQVLMLMHFALRVKGVLMLGSSETIGRFDSEFDRIDGAARIYSKRRAVRLFTDREVALTTPLSDRQAVTRSATTPGDHPPDIRLLRAYDSLLERYLPAGFLITSSRELVHTFGSAREIMHPPSGRINLDALDMVDQQLKVPMAAAIQRCKNEKKTVRYNRIHLENGIQGQHWFSVTASEISLRQDPPYYLISLEPENERLQISADVAEDLNRDELGREKVRAIEIELQYTRENLQASIEEMETSNEEINATNEELVAANEELQSTNEELHSVNEELHTVNAEHQSKIRELTEATNDLNNLLSSIQIGTLFLDKELRVRKFTSAIRESFMLRDQDLGRPISEIRHKLECDLVLDYAESVLQGEPEVEIETRRHDGVPLLLRMRPYLNENQKADGVVMTLVDISRVKAAEQESLAHKEETQVILDALPALIWFKDTKNRILRANHAAASAAGIPLAELENRSLEELYPDDAQSLFEADKVIIESGEPQLGAIEAKTSPAGEVTWMRTDKVPLLDEKGNVARVLVVSQDISELIVAQEDARTERDLKNKAKQERNTAIESEQVLQRLANQSPVVMWASDSKGDYTWVNHRFLEYTGKKEAEVLGRGWEDLIHADDRPSQLEEYADALENTRVFDLNFRLRAADGEYRWNLSRANPRFTEDGEFDGFYGTCTDVNDNRLAQETLEARVRERTEQLRVKVQELNIRNTELDQFARAASHDLRSPLLTIAGFTECLEEECSPEDEKIVEFLGRIRRATLRMGSLVDSLSMFSQVGRSQLRVEDIDLESVMVEVIADLHEDIHRTQAKIETVDLPTVQGDRVLLRQLFQNLISNAIKFSPQTPHIRIESDSSEDFAHIMVKDHGVGISPENLEAIFDPFVRVTRNQEAGTGVGLSICRRVVERHGGQVSVESTEGEGSTFHVRLPRTLKLEADRSAGALA